MAMYLGNDLVDGIINNGIIPSGTLNITENGTYDVSTYATANVDAGTEGGYKYQRTLAFDYAESDGKESIIIHFSPYDDLLPSTGAISFTFSFIDDDNCQIQGACFFENDSEYAYHAIINGYILLTYEDDMWVRPYKSYLIHPYSDSYSFENILVLRIPDFEFGDSGYDLDRLVQLFNSMVLNVFQVDYGV